MAGSRDSGSAQQPLLPSHKGDVGKAAQDYGAVAQGKAKQAASQAKQTARNAQQKLDDARPDIEYAVAAIKAGKLPTTDQLSSWLDWAQEQSVFQTGPYNKTGALSEEGERIVGDFKEVLEQLKRLAQTKNGDDKFQQFVWHASQADLSVDPVDPASFAPSEKQLRKDGNKAAHALRKLGWLIVSDSTFNNIIADLLFASRELLADAAGVASDKLREASDSARPSEADKSGASGVERRDAALGLNSGKQHGRTSSESEETKLKGVRASWDTDKTKSEAKGQLRQARRWIEERTGSPDEAKDDLIEKLKSTVVSIQENDDYQESVNTLLNLVKKYGREARSAVEKAKEEGKERVDANDHVDQALAHLRAIVESFANGKSLDTVLDAFQAVAKDIREDDRLGTYFDEVGDFVERALLDPGYIASSKASRHIDQLYDRAQELQKGNADWKRDAQQLSNALQEYGRALQDDEDSRALLLAFKNLGADLQLVAEQTASLLKGQAGSLYRDIADVWLPRLLASIDHVPLPKIEYKSADIDVIVDGINLAASGGSFIPDRVRILNNNEVNLYNGYAAFSSTLDTDVKVSVEGLRFKAQDIAFYFLRKNAFIHKRDWGLLTIDASGAKGINFVIHLEKAQASDRETYMKVKDVHVDVSALQVSVRKSHHPISNTLFLPLARPALRSTIGKLLEAQIASALEDADKQLFAMHERSVALSKYSGAAFNPFKSGGGGAPSVTGYFNALFGSGLNPFGMGSATGSSSVSAGKRGIVKKGRSGEWLLAIGSPQPIIDAQAGPKGWADKHAEKAAEAKRRLDMLSAKGRAELKKSAAKTDAQARELAQEDDWRSDAFDIPM